MIDDDRWDELQDEMATLRKELERLGAWKESAMKVLGDWDKVGDELGVKDVADLGGWIPEIALREAKRLNAENAMLNRRLDGIADAITRIEDSLKYAGIINPE